MKTVMTHLKSIMERISRNTLYIGIASLLWLLYRSGTKPSRMRYPCQQTCMVNVSMYLSPAVVPLTRRLIRARRTLSVGAVLRAVCAVALFFSCFLLVEATVERLAAFYAPPANEVVHQHGPIGVQLDTDGATGRPVYATSPQVSQLPSPNRVVSVHDSRATNWDHETHYHWEYIDQEIVDNMVALGILALTEETNLVDAWNALIPYQPGDEVVIKPNFNNAGCSAQDEDIDSYAEPTNAVIDGLVSIGVPLENIWITDPSRRVPDRFRDRLRPEYRDQVQYFSYWRCQVDNYHRVDYVDPASSDASDAQCPEGDRIRPAQVFVDAEHLINIPLFKSHGPYITLALKNHYGSVMYRDNDRSSMHYYFNQGGNTQGCELETKNILADINNNPHIRDKTRLVIGEGLFGNPHKSWQDTDIWEIFGNDDSNILFFSVDPVALSSVMADYIVAERGNQAHEHLHAAASLGLGVHEHWDSFENKHYTGIDYQIIDLDASQSAELMLQGEPADEAIRLTWAITGTLPPTSTWRIDYYTQTLNVFTATNPFSLTRSAVLTEHVHNYDWYTVTLHAMDGATFWLSDTVRVMPTDRFVFLPLILRQ